MKLKNKTNTQLQEFFESVVYVWQKLFNISKKFWIADLGSVVIQFNRPQNYTRLAEHSKICFPASSHPFISISGPFNKSSYQRKSSVNLQYLQSFYNKWITLANRLPPFQLIFTYFWKFVFHLVWYCSMQMSRIKI